MNAAPEGRWFLMNYLLLNAYVFVLSAIQGIVLLSSSSDGSIPGWSGSPIEQVFWYAFGTMFFVSVFYGIPVLLVALLAWRTAIHLFGRPRLWAYLVATLLVVVAALLVERTEPVYLAIILVAALGFATIVRAPASGALLRAAVSPVRVGSV